MAQDSVTLQLRGIDETLRNLAKIDKGIAHEIDEAISEAQDIIRTRAEDYPPRRPSSTYQRTGLLGRGWAKKKPRNFQGIVFNRVPYAPWVQGEATQAAVHKGRWPTTGDIVKEQEQKITGIFEAKIQKLTRAGR